MRKGGIINLAVALILFLFPGMANGITQQGRSGGEDRGRGSPEEGPEEAHSSGDKSTSGMVPEPTNQSRKSMSHKGQGGLGLIVGTGYRGLIRYQGSGSCEASGSSRTFCHSRLPTFLDIEGSFGLTQALSIIADFRLGLEKDFTHSRPFAVAPGIKYYVDPAARTKFFVTMQVALDFTAQLPDVPRVDVGIRNAVGLQFDMHRLFGFWLQLGDTLAFRRYFRFELDGALGIEGRFPP